MFQSLLPRRQNTVCRVIIALPTIALVLSSCMLGEDFFSVTGNILDAQGRPLDSCMIALEAVKKDEDAYPLAWEETESEIKRTFIWPFDRKAKYRLAILCHGYLTPYRTTTFIVGDAIEAWPQPVDFGAIVMEK